MFKLVVLSALVAVAMAAPGHLAVHAPLAYTSHVVGPSVSVPTAVSHSSRTDVHRSGVVATTYTAPAVVATQAVVAAPAVHAVQTAYAAPALHAAYAAPYGTYAAPALHATYAAPAVSAYTAGVHGVHGVVAGHPAVSAYAAGVHGVHGLVAGHPVAYQL